MGDLKTRGINGHLDGYKPGCFVSRISHKINEYNDAPTRNHMVVTCKALVDDNRSTD